MTGRANLTAADLGSVHFMGIGGAGMSGIARIMAMRGIAVSGCDLKDSRALTSLRALGVKTEVGHDPKHLDGVQTLVYSSAIRPSVSEFASAQEQGIRILQRAQALAALMAERRVIAVAGTHGKTTTTSMMTVVLQHAGLDPSFAIGGTITDSGAHAHDGSGHEFVVEADESDGSFVHYFPEIAIITNIEADHMDHYADDDAVFGAFKSFSNTVSGPLVVCGDDLTARSLLSGRTGITYGFGESDLQITDVQSHRAVSFAATWKGKSLGRFSLSIPGVHNALNAGAVIAVALHLGLEVETIRSGLAVFTGTRRRFEVRGQSSSVAVIDDYAHHPTEITATLKAARDVYPGRQVIAVFQPHRYSRTAAFLSEFAESLKACDVAIITEVYAAGESAIPGATGAALTHLAQQAGVNVIFEPSLSAIASLVQRTLQGDAVVLTLGAGDITLISGDIADLVCVAGS